jgi:hypothetical protein
MTELRDEYDDTDLPAVPPSTGPTDDGADDAVPTDEED